MASGSLYLLTGTETFLRRRRLTGLVEERLPEGLGDFNYVRIDGKETALVDILSTWEERGFGGDRVIHVDNVDKIRMKKDDKVSELFLKRAKTGVPHALMILEAESVDRRKAFYKKLSALAVSEEFKPLRDYQVPGFIAGELSAKGYVIDPDAAEFMAMFTSSELMVIASELEKLILYIGPDQTRITLDDTRGLLMPSRQYTLFDVQDALVDGKKDLAIRAVRGLLEEGTSPVAIWRFINNMMERAWRLENAGSKAEVNRISKSSFYISRLQQLASRLRGNKLERAVVDCRKLAMAARQGSLTPGFYLEQLINTLFQRMR